MAQTKMKSASKGKAAAKGRATASRGKAATKTASRGKATAKTASRGAAAGRTKVAAKGGKTNGATKRTTRAKSTGTKRTARGGLLQTVQPDDMLSAIVGSE